MKSIELTLKYKTGVELKQVVNYVQFENGCLHYTLKKQVHDLSVRIVKIPLEKLVSFYIDETDEQWN